MAYRGYEIDREELLLEQTSMQAGGGFSACDAYDIHFQISDPEFEGRKFRVSYARGMDGTNPVVVFYEDGNIPGTGEYWEGHDFPTNTNVDMASLEGYAREKGATAMKDLPPIAERRARAEKEINERRIR